MGSTEVNSWFTLISSIITVGSIWSDWFRSRRERREQRINSVASRFIEMRLADESVLQSAAPLKPFISAGALSLSQDEMEECAKQLARAHGPNPLEHTCLRSQEVLARAIAKGVNLDDWADRTSFLVGEALPAEATQPGTAKRT